MIPIPGFLSCFLACFRHWCSGIFRRPRLSRYIRANNRDLLHHSALSTYLWRSSFQLAPVPARPPAVLLLDTKLPVHKERLIRDFDQRKQLLVASWQGSHPSVRRANALELAGITGLDGPVDTRSGPCCVDHLRHRERMPMPARYSAEPASARAAHRLRAPDSVRGPASPNLTWRGLLRTKGTSGTTTALPTK